MHVEAELDDVFLEEEGGEQHERKLQAITYYMKALSSSTAFLMKTTFSLSQFTTAFDLNMSNY